MDVNIGDENGNSVKVGATGITNTAIATCQTTASTMYTQAAALNVNAGMSRFSGTVQYDTIIASSVVGSSYTPGAGNVW